MEISPRRNASAMRFRLSASLCITLVCLIPCGRALAQVKPGAGSPAGSLKQARLSPPTEPVDAAAMENFEKKIRPALVQYCYECHSQSAKKSLGGLVLDSRKAMLQ